MWGSGPVRRDADRPGRQQAVPLSQAELYRRKEEHRENSSFICSHTDSFTAQNTPLHLYMKWAKVPSTAAVRKPARGQNHHRLPIMTSRPKKWKHSI